MTIKRYKQRLAVLAASILCLLVLLPSATNSRPVITIELGPSWHDGRKTMDIKITVTFEKNDKTQSAIRIPNEWVPADSMSIGESGVFPGLTYSSTLSDDLNSSHPRTGQTWWAFEDATRTLDALEVGDSTVLYVYVDASASGGIYETSVGMAVGDDAFGWTDIRENCDFPPTASVPSLTVWGTAILCVLLGVSAVLILRRRKGVAVSGV